MRTDTRHAPTEHSVERNLVRWLLKQVGSPNISVRLWNGDEFPLTEAPPVACMEFRSPPALFALLRSPALGFGDGYSQGQVEIHGDFLAFINEITRAVTQRNKRRYYGPKLGSLLHALHPNSLARSRDNVHHHYDLGNDFYELWLDEHMVYTCAYYETSDASLAEAQVAKLDHVCRKLGLQPGQKVIEAGSGWGALALHMAENYGVDVIAYNNSVEQVAYAREQAAIRKLDDRVTFVLDDYRNINERCDVFVSVGMLEHVGRANYKTLGTVVERCLKPDGLGLIHSIGRSHPRKADAWLLKRIFPGGHVPSLGEMMPIFEPHKFSILDIENLRLHYARTCKDWLQNFEACRDTVEKMYDRRFARMWRLYLAGSSAAFQSGTLQLYQVLFAPHDNNRVPVTRRYQYREGAETD